MAVDRLKRLNPLLQKELATLFEFYIAPALPNALVTVTGVEVASDLRNANVYVSVYGAKGMEARVLDLLQKKRPLLQSGLNRKVIMKYTPILNFRLDHTAERADRVERILAELHLEPEELKKSPEMPESGAPEG